MNQTDKPHWYPKVFDAEYAAKLRSEYDDAADLDDEELKDEFNNGVKYVTTWDHLRDAYASYEPLADAYLKLEKIADIAISALGNIDKQCKWTGSCGGYDGKIDIIHVAVEKALRAIEDIKKGTHEGISPEQR